MPIVELREVSKNFREVAALQNFSLSVDEEEYVTIIGPSGCGKTTALRVIAGIIQPDSGEVLLRGNRVNDVAPEDRDLGYLFQNILLFPHMNVRDNIGYGPMVRGEPPEVRDRVAKEILNLLNLFVRKEAFPAELSRGFQQKVALARTIATASPILLLDEPLSSLDARVRVILRYELRRIVKNLHLTAIHVTHDQEEALSLGDRVIVMRKGKIEQIGTPRDLYYHPRSLFVARFIGGESNFLTGQHLGGTEEFSSVSVGKNLVFKALKVGTITKRDVVLSFKPEHVYSHEIAAANRLTGRVEDINCLGALWRITISTQLGEIIMKTPRIEQSYKEGMQVDIFVRSEDTLAFPLPEEGLERAIEIE